MDNRSTIDNFRGLRSAVNPFIKRSISIINLFWILNGVNFVAIMATLRVFDGNTTKRIKITKIKKSGVHTVIINQDQWIFRRSLKEFVSPDNGTKNDISNMKNNSVKASSILSTTIVAKAEVLLIPSCSLI